jgi:hypothetical protein
MHKSGKRRNFMGSWERPYDFVSYRMERDVKNKMRAIELA